MLRIMKPVIEETLRAWAEKAMRTSSDLGASLDGFVAYMSAKLVAPDSTETPPRLLHGADLYLVYACLERGPAAIAHFEVRCVPEVDRVLQRMRIPPALAGDIKGRLRERLFYPRDGERSPLLSYSGRGELKKWIRSVAMRDALAALRAAGKVEAADDDAVCMLAAGDNPELAYLKATFATAFKSAVREAMESFSPRERNLLRQHVLDGLTVDQLGQLYGVHRATAARWVASARRGLLENVRQRLMTTLQLSEAGFYSAVRLARSQLDISVERFFVDTN